MKCTIVGAARSGLSSAILARKLGYNVFLTELNTQEKFKDTIEKLKFYDIPYEFGQHSKRAIENKDLIILSPGVPPDAPLVVEAENRKIKIISELEFSRLACPDNPLIAITGTNGKTTTTALTEFILTQAGKKAIACGNIGTPLSAIVENLSKDTIIVAEVSSFQLDRIDTFRPDIAVILNITPDHLYYHSTMEKYISAKFKISLNQNEKNLLILNADDKLLLKGMPKIRASIAYISLSPVARGMFATEGKIIYKDEKQHIEEEIMLTKEIRIPGVHNIYNSLASALAARAMEVHNENIRDSLMRFQGVEHRLESVRILDGVEYINDSKATNVNATWYALNSFDKPIIWIAGGRGNNDYSELDELVAEKVIAIIAIGEESDIIFNHFASKVRCYKEPTLENAVLKARNIAQKGQIVLFTPACKSFDMFLNFEHRGEVFKSSVMSLV